MPPVSDTEREALASGTVGWDGELFSGQPDWRELSKVSPITLSKAEKEFLEGPAEQLCALIDDWQIRHELRDIPPPIWRFLKKHGFFGMLISREYGGLGFSSQAQSLIIGKIASRSPDVATVVMVPNSLGPGELVEKYGTNTQKEQYLHKLARGEEIPCFALTAPYSGSDAADMRDVGVVCKGEHNGKAIVGIKLRWNKRYATLAPVATVIGLAFKLRDPDRLLGEDTDPGITLALVPANHPGVEIGARHIPGGNIFPNGPTWAEDVFIPLEWVIGGKAGVGRGWAMLMNCLSEGRAISLPAMATAAVKTMLRHTTAYALVRRQFGIPLAAMEGIGEPLARITENAYVLEAARSVTASMVDSGEKPAVISALLKYNATEMARRSINDAMDIHAGRGICDGPANYLQAAYQAVPIGITVEGANILTRTLITFAQGALRSHPFLYQEMAAVLDKDIGQGIKALDRAVCAHVSYSLANVFGALVHNITGGLFASAPKHAHETERWYRQLHRCSVGFALISDVTVVALAGSLKLRQRITGRLADALSELYLLSCVLKRFEDDGEPAEDLHIVDLCARNSLYRFQVALAGVLDNFPSKAAAVGLRFLIFPLGQCRRPAPDWLAQQVVKSVTRPGELRDRLTNDIFINSDPDDITGILEHTFTKVAAAEETVRKLEKVIRNEGILRNHSADWIGQALEKRHITTKEEELLRELEHLVGKVISVDHFQAVKPVSG
jgi:acyl-CoA dehydrogenase